MLKKTDFKYKDVQKSGDARKKFIDALNASGGQVHLYAFYVHGGCMAHERNRTEQAAQAYGTKYSPPQSPRGFGHALLSSFIGYMACCIGAHACTNNYAVDVYWDRRPDLDQIKELFDDHIAHQSKSWRYPDVKSRVTFCGRAQDKLSPITRLAGVLAGDIWKFFALHGHRIWSKFDPAGLLGPHDPHVDFDDPSATGPPCIATVKERLADSKPFSPSTETVMVQGYYRRFLKSEQGERLISFGDPAGRLGGLGILHGNLWKVYQLPD